MTDFLHRMLRAWLSDLQVSSVDLQQYGEQKTALRLRDQLNWTFFWWGLGYIYLMNFSYGSQPEDWQLWFSEPSDRYAGQFWAMTETREYRTHQFQCQDHGRKILISQILIIPSQTGTLRTRNSKRRAMQREWNHIGREAQVIRMTGKEKKEKETRNSTLFLRVSAGVPSP